MDGRETQRTLLSHTFLGTFRVFEEEACLNVHLRVRGNMIENSNTAKTTRLSSGDSMIGQKLRSIQATH